MRLCFSAYFLPFAVPVIGLVYCRLTWEDYEGLVSNITEIVDVHETLLKGLKEWSTSPAEQQRIGRLFLTTAVKLKQVHEKYCSSHPKAVLILDKFK